MADETTNSALQGAATGAGTGAAFGPYGAAIGAIAGAGLGYYQAQQGKSKLEELERPEYEIPDEYFQVLSSAERRAAEGMPQEQKREFVDNLARSRQAALRAGETRIGGLMNVVDLQLQEQSAYSNLVSKDAQMRRQAQQYADQMQLNIAKQREKQFAVNELQPYQQQLQSAQAMVGSGYQNIGGAINTATTAGTIYSGTGSDGGSQGQTTQPSSGPPAGGSPYAYDVTTFQGTA